MKNRKTELDVDFIGEQRHVLKPEEAQAISDFIRAEKAKRASKKKPSKSRTASRLRHTA